MCHQVKDHLMSIPANIFQLAMWFLECFSIIGFDGHVLNPIDKQLLVCKKICLFLAMSENTLPTWSFRSGGLKKFSLIGKAFFSSYNSAVF